MYILLLTKNSNQQVQNSTSIMINDETTIPPWNIERMKKCHKFLGICVGLCFLYKDFQPECENILPAF